MSVPTRTLAILFADIGGSTALYESVGDAEAHRRVAESLAFMKSAIEEHGGALLRSVGDAVLATFERCDDACLAACAMQRLHLGGTLSVRVGFHVGAVIPDGGDVYGTAVNVAARIAAFALTEEIALSEPARRALSPALAARTALLDTRELKGLARPLAIHRLEWRERSDVPVTAVAGPVGRAGAGGGTVRLRLLHAARRLTLDAGRPRIDIGRGEENDVVLDDPQASRRHARLELVRRQVLLVEQSTNGTWLLREGRPAVHVRRDTVVLEGSGRLAAGTDPAEGGAVPLAFSVDEG